MRLNTEFHVREIRERAMLLKFAEIVEKTDPGLAQYCREWVEEMRADAPIVFPAKDC